MSSVRTPHSSLTIRITNFKRRRRAYLLCVAATKKFVHSDTPVGLSAKNRKKPALKPMRLLVISAIDEEICFSCSVTSSQRGSVSMRERRSFMDLNCIFWKAFWSGSSHRRFPLSTVTCLGRMKQQYGRRQPPLPPRTISQTPKRLLCSRVPVASRDTSWCIVAALRAHTVWRRGLRRFCDIRYANCAPCHWGSWPRRARRRSVG